MYNRRDFLKKSLAFSTIFALFPNVSFSQHVNHKPDSIGHITCTDVSVKCHDCKKSVPLCKTEYLNNPWQPSYFVACHKYSCMVQFDIASEGLSLPWSEEYENSLRLMAATALEEQLNQKD